LQSLVIFVRHDWLLFANIQYFFTVIYSKWVNYSTGWVN